MLKVVAIGRKNAGKDPDSKHEAYPNALELLKQDRDQGFVLVNSDRNADLITEKIKNFCLTKNERVLIKRAK